MPSRTRPRRSAVPCCCVYNNELERERVQNRRFSEAESAAYSDWPDLPPRVCRHPVGECASWRSGQLDLLSYDWVGGATRASERDT